jgi:hypothetical protein
MPWREPRERLAPGVYFAREEPQDVDNNPPTVRKVIVTR